MEINSALGPLDIAVSGIRTQGKNLEIISSNIANARTTNAGKGLPYRRLAAHFKTDGDKVGGVRIDKVTADTSPFGKIHDPANPDADKDGYVLMPNVNLPIEMMNMTVASRAYQANTAVLKRYQQMVESSLELLK